jgi:hypothetical protein
MQEETKAVIDAVAVGGTVGTLAGFLPPLAALATCFSYYCVDLSSYLGDGHC